MTTEKITSLARRRVDMFFRTLELGEALRAETGTANRACWASVHATVNVPLGEKPPVSYSEELSAKRREQEKFRRKGVPP